MSLGSVAMEIDQAALRGYVVGPGDPSYDTVLDLERLLRSASSGDHSLRGRVGCHRRREVRATSGLPVAVRAVDTPFQVSQLLTAPQ